MKNGKLKKLILTALVLLLTTGCAAVYGDGLLSLPKLPGEYLQLQNRLDEVLSSGAVYAVAETGADRQAVQMVDIDGDSDDEVIAFFRNASGVYSVYVFKYDGSDYVQIGYAEGYGTSLHSVSYPMLADGSMAIALSWGFDEATTFGMTVFGFNENNMYSMLDVRYSSTLIGDINNDLTDELSFVVRDSMTGRYKANIYALKGDMYSLVYEAELCIELKSVSNMRIGTAERGFTALFIDSSASGGGYVTDVVRFTGTTAVNDTLDSASGSGMATWRQISVSSADIDGDGYVEVPVSRHTEASAIGGDLRYRLSWCSFRDGQMMGKKAETFHDTASGWYFVWPDKWRDTVMPQSINTVYSSAVSFYVPTLANNQSGNGYEEPEHATLLTIYCFSGDNRAEYVQLYSNLKILRATAKEIYCYSIPDGEASPLRLTEEEVLRSFYVIEKNWLVEGR
ncbi:MAG: hypothetical protein IJU78_06930 [Clostridia bacterium]|nr:hypothetical protein [Clostridia bacterium]